MGIGNKLLSPYIRNKIGHNCITGIKDRLLENKNLINEEGINYIPIKYPTDGKEEFILEIQNGRIFSSWGFVLKNNKLIDGILPYNQILTNYDEIGGRISSYFIRRKKRISGNVFSLQSIWNVCYGHWIHEALPKLFLLKDSGLFDKVDFIALGDGAKSRFHMDSLKLLGCEKKEIIYVSDETEIECDNLIVASFPGLRTHNPPKWVCNKYMEISKALLRKNKNKEYYEKIYISRNKAPTRKVVNEDEIINLLKPYGYKVLHMEDYSLEEQFCIFYNAKKIISPHGSSLTNIVCLMKDKTSILDIIPKICYEDVYKDISSTIGIKYFEYIESNEENFLYYGKNNRNNDFDMKINIKDFLECLKEFENL